MNNYNHKVAGSQQCDSAYVLQEGIHLRYYLAIDIGASSGRHIVGWQEDGTLHTKEVYRFPNGVKEENGHLVWDVQSLVLEVKAGIVAAMAAFDNIASLSIDTWGVDYVLLKGDEEVYPVYAYRDSRAEAVIPQVHEKMPFSDLYRRTGCQFQPSNTIYQLYNEKLNGRLEGVTDMLMMPEYLLWKLCGVKAREYTNATEKAAQIYMLTAHLPRINTIRDDQMVELAEFFGVKYRKDFLNL